MNTPRILIVDDEASIRLALQRWFNVRGFVADEAASGEEAVVQCAENEYDVITMDLDMPGLGGEEAIAQIKKLHAKVPIVVLTGYPRNAAAALSNGAAKILTKPIRLKDLESEVREVMP